MTDPDSFHERVRGAAVLLVVFAAALVAVVLAANWLGSRAGSSSGDATPDPSAGPADTGPVVLAISIDGLRPDAITKLGNEGTPNLHRLMKQGASTLNARTAYESTKTLPNHTGMLTGRGVDGKVGHGITFNNDEGGTLATVHGAYVPGMFDVAHDHGRQTAFFAEKDKFHFLMRSWDAQHGRKDTIGPDNGRDKTDIDRVAPAAQIVPEVQAALRDGRTDLIFLHLTAPDEAGHDHEWLSSEYMDAVEVADRWVGEVLATVDASPALKKRLSVLVTADHGGQDGDTTHYEIDNRENYQIPFIAWGRGFPAGADLYKLNPNRRYPGVDRPEYSGPQPIRNMDIANTSLRLLRLQPVAGAVATSWPPLTIRP